MYLPGFFLFGRGDGLCRAAAAAQANSSISIETVQRAAKDLLELHSQVFGPDPQDASLLWALPPLADFLGNLGFLPGVSDD